MLHHLRDRLFERMEEKAGRSIVVLLDPNHPVSHAHPLHLGRLEKRQTVPALTVVPRDDRMREPETHPRLLLLRGAEDRGYPDEELLALTLDCAQQRRLSINGTYVCGWLVVHAPAQEIALQLKRGIAINDASVRKRRVVPLFEPHRLVLASRLASPQWLNRWLGSISSWFLVDACGQLKELRPAPYDAAEVVAPPGVEFWQAQARVKQARDVLLTMTKAGQVVPVDCEFRLDEALRMAYREGLQDAEDVIFFAANQMALPAHWHAHPAVRACIADAVAGTAPLTDGMSSLSDEVLEELASADAGETWRRNVQGRA